MVISVGSRFCSPTESRFSPIEVELLGETWALSRTSHYPLECPDLLSTTTVGSVWSKRELGQIDNPRLEALAEKTMKWRFSIEHVASAKNYDLDAIPCYPGPGGLGAG